MQRTEAGLLLLIYAVVITNQIRFFFFTESPRGVGGKAPFEKGTLFLILPEANLLLLVNSFCPEDHITKTCWAQFVCRPSFDP